MCIHRRYQFIEFTPRSFFGRTESGTYRYSPEIRCNSNFCKIIFKFYLLSHVASCCLDFVASSRRNPTQPKYVFENGRDSDFFSRHFELRAMENILRCELTLDDTLWLNAERNKKPGNIPSASDKQSCVGDLMKKIRNCFAYFITQSV